MSDSIEQGNTKKQRTIELRKKNQQELLIQQLEALPVIQIACEKSGISRATYYRWREDKIFSTQADNALRNGKLVVNDLAISQIIRKIKDGHFGASKYWLTHNDEAFRPKLAQSLISDENIEIEEIRKGYNEILKMMMKN